jgi:hypothetical protein
MPGSKFDPSLVVTNGRILPGGTLGQQPGEKAVQLYVWVVQFHDDGTSAACIGFQDEDALSDDTWTVRSDAIHEGEFKHGQAFAMAVKIAKVVSGETSPVWRGFATPSDGATRVYWWNERIVLQDPE